MTVDNEWLASAVMRMEYGRWIGSAIGRKYVGAEERLTSTKRRHEKDRESFKSLRGVIYRVEIEVWFGLN